MGIIKVNGEDAEMTETREHFWGHVITVEYLEVCELQQSIQWFCKIMTFKVISIIGMRL